MEFDLYEAAGNCFALLDVRLTGTPDDPAALAREVCEVCALRAGWRADGLLLLLRGPEHADGAMRIYNADGSRAEACGNGLRAVAWHLVRSKDREEFVIETDTGLRRTQLVVREGDGARIRTELGTARLDDLSEPLPDPYGAHLATKVDIGNPHCVLEVDDEGALDLARLARVVEAHPDFPDGVNVGVVARGTGAWHLRVHERGVGETEACGTGACAAALALVRRGRTELPTEVWLPGGPLVVHGSAEDGVSLSGSVSHVGHTEAALSS